MGRAYQCIRSTSPQIKILVVSQEGKVTSYCIYILYVLLIHRVGTFLAWDHDRIRSANDAQSSRLNRNMSKTLPPLTSATMSPSYDAMVTTSFESNATSSRPSTASHTVYGTATYIVYNQQNNDSNRVLLTIE